MKRLKILFLSQRFLFPQDTGGKIRTSKILEKLSKNNDLTVISNVEIPKDEPYLDDTAKIAKKFIPVYWKEAKRYSMKFYFNVLKRSFSKYPVTMLNDFSKGLENALLTELQNEDYDLAICDFMQSTLNFRKIKNIPTMLFTHNVEAMIAKRHMDNSKNPAMKVFWWLQYRKMKYWEGKMVNKFDGVIVVSDNDEQIMKDWYGIAEKIYKIPTGVDTDYYQPREVAIKEKQMVFVGAMDWLPNEDAMYYMVNNIFPLVKQKEKDASMVIVGRNPSARIEKAVSKIDDIEMTGWVDDTRDYIHESSIFVVPIRIGGGTRIKIYEAMACGKPVISTSIGAEGLPLEHGKHVYLEDNATDFANRIIELYNSKTAREQMGQSARNYVYENYRWEIVAKVFYDICDNVVNQKIEN